MRAVFTFAFPLALAIPTSADMPPVYLYHDDTFASFGYLEAPKSISMQEDTYWPILTGGFDQTKSFHGAMLKALGEALSRNGIETQLVDASGWLEICGNRQRAIVVDVCQSVPDIIYAGQDDGSPLELWLEGGGILIYSGDWPFYWYSDATGNPRGEGAWDHGDDDIFDVDLVKEGFVGIPVTPTEEAGKWLPSLRGATTARPFDFTAIQRACPQHEVYSQGERVQGEERLVAADAVAFRLPNADRSPNADGWFVGFHFFPGRHTDTAQVILEFLTRRAAALFGGEAQ